MEGLERSLEERFAAAVASRRRESAAAKGIRALVTRLIGRGAAAEYVRRAREREGRALREQTPPPST